MAQTEKLPDSESFTKEVETVIDDLFTPAKNIEIDPLTNEVKEKEVPVEAAGETTGEHEEITLELNELIEEPPASEPAEEKVLEDSPQGAQDDLLELDLKLELEPAPSMEMGTHPEESPEGTADSPDIGAAAEGILSELQQAIWTLEWEVTKESVRSARDVLKAVRREPLSSEPGVHEVLDLMEGVLRGMEKGPESMPTSAPGALKQGVEFLNACASAQASPDEIQNLLQRAKSSLKAAHTRGVPTSKHSKDEFADQFDSLELELEPMEETDELEREEVREAVPVEQPESEPPPISSEPKGESRSEKGDVPSESIESARPPVPGELLQELKTCVERIKPVEALLARTKGMEKLHLFLQDLRRRLERQIEALPKYQARPEFDLFVPPVSDEGPEPAMPPVSEGSPQEQTGDQGPRRCPWDALLIARKGNTTVGFLVDEVAYEGAVPWWAGKGLMKQRKISLKSLKPWPWSRLSGLFQGELAGKGESELASLEVPVIESPEPDGDAQKGRNVIVLHKGSKTAVVFLDEETEHVAIKEEHTFEPGEEGGPWEGTLEMDGKTIKVISVSRVA